MIKLATGKHGTLLDTQKSDTIDKVYQIRWDKETGYMCECIGWRKNRPCKHIKRFGFKAGLLAKLTLDRETINTILDVAKDTWKGIV
jgi:hypothetical protein